MTGITIAFIIEFPPTVLQTQRTIHMGWMTPRPTLNIELSDVVVKESMVNGL